MGLAPVRDGQQNHHCDPSTLHLLQTAQKGGPVTALLQVGNQEKSVLPGASTSRTVTTEQNYIVLKLFY